MSFSVESLITEVEVRSIEERGGLVGFASFVFAECLYLSSIGIHRSGEKGYRLTYPTRNNHHGSYHIFHPINKEMGSLIENIVIGEFKLLLEKEASINKQQI